MFFPELLPIVPTVSVQISTRGTTIVGETYTLMCSVTGVESLNATTNFEWRDNDWNLVSSDAALTFNPLLSSHGGRYTCRATVSTPYLENDFNFRAREYVSVESKFTRKRG